MRYLSATDLAIALASKADTLRMQECTGRFGPYIAISDEKGLIEVHDSWATARQRVAACTE